MTLHPFRVRFYSGDYKKTIDFYVNSYSFSSSLEAGKALRKASGIDGNKYRNASVRILDKFN